LANIIFKDGYGYEKVRKATGSGTQADPFIPVYECEADLTFTTPVPVVGAGIDIPVTMDGEPLEDTAAGDLAAISLATTALAVATPDTAAGDLASISADVATVAAAVSTEMQCDIVTLPSGNLGMQTMAASLSVVPASDITDATYIGDIKFGEELPAGTQLLGKVGIDQVSANANEVVVKSITAGSNIIGKVSIDQTTPGTTNAVHASIVGTKGSVTTAHNAITATTTSTEVDCTGYNGLIVHATMTDSKEWKVKVVGSPTTGGTFVDCYDAATQMTLTSSTGKCVLWKGIPEFVKIVATENSDGGACTVVVQPVMI
jgi:hypothetical protein